MPSKPPKIHRVGGFVSTREKVIDQAKFPKFERLEAIVCLAALLEKTQTFVWGKQSVRLSTGHRNTGSSPNPL